MSHIDIVIPVYNQASSLKKCLVSLFNQTYTNFSITIIDDGSKDDVGKNLDINLVKKVKVIRQINKGAAAARNMGASEGNGEFLIFCDADIIAQKNFLSDLVLALHNNPTSSYAYSSFIYGWKKFLVGEFKHEKLQNEPFIHTTSLIRRKHFVGFDESLKRFQDWDLYLSMLEKGYTGVWVPQYLFKIKPGGTMSSWLPSFFYKFFPKNKKVIAYKNSMEIIKKKHGI